MAPHLEGQVILPDWSFYWSFLHGPSIRRGWGGSPTYLTGGGGVRRVTYLSGLGGGTGHIPTWLGGGQKE